MMTYLKHFEAIIFASLNPKLDIMSNKTCSVFTSLVSRVALIWLVFWAPFWHHDIQKKESSETRVALVQASLVSHDARFW